MLLVVVLYLASFGPVAGLAAHGRISGRTHTFLCDTVYLPLCWAEFNTSIYEHAVGAAYVRYVEWFETL
jgi:hypothetical protein